MVESEDVAELPEVIPYDKVLRLKLQADGVPYNNIEQHLGDEMVKKEEFLNLLNEIRVDGSEQLTEEFFQGRDEMMPSELADSMRSRIPKYYTYDSTVEREYVEELVEKFKQH